MQVFKEWRAWSKQSRFHKNCMAQCMSAKAATMLERTWIGWRMTASRKAYQHTVLAKSLSKIRINLVTRAFAGWRETATDRRRLRSILHVGHLAYSMARVEYRYP